jgi:hypothetical protein
MFFSKRLNVTRCKGVYTLIVYLTMYLSKFQPLSRCTKCGIYDVCKCPGYSLSMQRTNKKKGTPEAPAMQTDTPSKHKKNKMLRGASVVRIILRPDLPRNPTLHNRLRKSPPRLPLRLHA